MVRLLSTYVEQKPFLPYFKNNECCARTLCNSVFIKCVYNSWSEQLNEFRLKSLTQPTKTQALTLKKKLSLKGSGSVLLSQYIYYYYHQSYYCSRRVHKINSLKINCVVRLHGHNFTLAKIHIVPFWSSILHDVYA